MKWPHPFDDFLLDFLRQCEEQKLRGKYLWFTSFQGDEENSDQTFDLNQEFRKWGQTA